MLLHFRNPVHLSKCVSRDGKGRKKRSENSIPFLCLWFVFSLFLKEEKKRKEGKCTSEVTSFLILFLNYEFVLLGFRWQKNSHQVEVGRQPIRIRGLKQKTISADYFLQQRHGAWMPKAASLNSNGSNLLGHYNCQLISVLRRY